MIKQYIELGRGGWYVYVYYGVNKYNINEVVQALQSLNCPSKDILTATRIMSTGLNAGMTYSNSKIKTSLVCIGEADSKEQFLNTVVHESKHVQSHICWYYHIKEDSEQAAYLIGHIVQRMYKMLQIILYLFFKEHGCYTLAPRGTTDYIQYWDREKDRCINGFVAEDGDAITGYHYFYLNYSPIMRLDEVEYTDRYGNKRTRRERILDFPLFWDYDYYYFNAIEEAETQGKHMAVLKARQRGYSFKGASMLVRNYELIKGSKSFAVASEQKFLVGDGLLTKAWQIMDFIDKNTAWAKQRLTSTRMERVSGFKIKDEFGKETEQGYLSSITGITLKNDPERLRGTRGKLVLFEEGGKFPNLETAWRIEQPAVETDDGVAFGLLIAFGTGGTEGGSFDGLKNLFYNPKAFNVLSFPNIWDDGQEQTECGFFVPSWSNMGEQFMDKDGNTYKEKAIEELIKQRNVIKDGGATQVSIDRFISERPLKPQEAVLELGKNIFPRKLLMDQLTRIRTNKKLQSMKHIVDLTWDGNGQVKATEKKSGDITTYHLKKDDKPDGSVVIWEYPIDDPPFGLYIGGCDPYDHDESFTNSLGSTFIFKRVKAGEAWQDVIVAEYSGRPATAEEYYENVRKLLMFYNARLLFENERKGIYPYFTNKHCDYLLADQPDKIITEVFKDSKVQRRKGCHMTKQIRAYGEGLILEWLLDEYEPGHPNIERIYSEALIEELIENDGVKNVDRLIALCMVMIYREELYQIKVSAAKERNKQVELFELPLFSTQYWNTEEQTVEDNIPLFTF